jgi:hypothetical protein
MLEGLLDSLELFKRERKGFRYLRVLQESDSLDNPFNGMVLKLSARGGTLSPCCCGIKRLEQPQGQQSPCRPDLPPA